MTTLIEIESFLYVVRGCCIMCVRSYVPHNNKNDMNKRSTIMVLIRRLGLISSYAYIMPCTNK
jgi:hypothetical protein